MFHYDYKTENTCSQVISLDLDGNVVHNVSFMGGCNGNLKAIPILIEGWSVEDVESKLTGVLCGRRPTSCADQLAKAVRAAYEAEQQVSKLLEGKHIPLAKEEFYCRGSFTVMHRGRPNADDCEAAAEFARKVISREG